MPKKKLYQSPLMLTCIGCLLATSVFGVGFATFVFMPRTNTQNIGDINVEVGGIASANITQTSPAIMTKMTYGGFYPDGSVTASNEGSITFNFDLDVNIKKAVTFSVSLKQIDSQANEFSIANYVDSIELKAVIGQKQPAPLSKTTSIDQRKKTAVATFSTADSCINITETSQMVKISTTVTYSITYTGSDFAHEIFKPFYEKVSSIVLEVRGNG